ncbi:response regulator transcription factor [Streptococcus pluranimalium]|uniref:AgrA n=1 Tax=Streptococcus pluranimalium TaxID=82348 RepID=A0A345VLB5_9STRE|nr:response regulator transcription factor [Streptococcus pluranimalium]AXJ13517.1 agrA [Streptococcus pluranimalium]
MNIFVLEDDFAQQTRIEKIIQKITTKHKIPLRRFEVYGKPDQLLAASEDKGAIQLFFLDIEIKNEEMKGLEVAKKITTKDSRAHVVFVTTHSEFMPLSFRYQIKALDYIDKGLDTLDFEQRIEDSILYTQTRDSKTVAEDFFYFESRYNQIQYPFNDLLYIEASPRPHRVILHTTNDRMEFTASLSDVMKKDKRLLQCHRSYLVNPSNVIRVDRHERIAYLKDGSTCLVARHKLNLLLKSIKDLH